MRVIGALLLLAGSAGTVMAVRGMFAARRPRDVAFAVLGPLALIAALSGAVLLFVPTFF
jgi:hypothetical protein